MGIKVSVLAEEPLVLIGIVFALLTVRGLPVVLCEIFFNTHSGLESTHERVQLGLYAAAGLPILVAVTNVALHNALISEKAASLLVAGGALTILIFPLQATAIHRIFGSTVKEPQVSSTKEKINRKKSERTKTVRTVTSTIPVVKPSKATEKTN